MWDGVKDPTQTMAEVTSVTAVLLVAVGIPGAIKVGAETILAGDTAIDSQMDPETAKSIAKEGLSALAELAIALLGVGDGDVVEQQMPRQKDPTETFEQRREDDP